MKQMPYLIHEEADYLAMQWEVRVALGELEVSQLLISVFGTERDEESTEAVMRRLADEYALAAENALKCGFDMILIHGGHGLLLSQILSPKYNTRTDAFGGSLENRMKLPLTVLKAIRERVGRKLLIEYRISGDELAGPDGFTVRLGSSCA